MEQEKKTAPDMRNAMPKTAEWVASMRKRHGNEWVTEQIRRGMKGEPGHFYALEGGYVLGTPLPTMADWQDFAVVTGCPFAGFMAVPEVEKHGAH